ncbi:MAG TPA: methyltransferase domain-containing protein [Gaiellaceae bacterium]|nr:methyltransferase domain-containing protein [Gaiellaceae bacterium]
MEVRGVEVELVEEAVAIGGRALTIVHPRSADELIDEEAFEREEFLPYWAELWPSAVELARAVAARELAGARVVELGCGLALPSIVAVLGGAEALATDWSEDALRFARTNAQRNGAAIETARVDWAAPDALLARAPYDLVLAADVLYERRNAELLLPLLPQLADEVLLADPGRPAERSFLDRAAAEWRVETSGRVHRLLRRG